MQIMITTSASRAPKVLQFTPLTLSLSVIALLVPLMLVSLLLYHALLIRATQSHWPVLANAVGFIERQEVAQKDRFMRENLDAMATKVGDLQARLVHMEAVSERVAGMAGMKAEEFRQIEAPSGVASGAGGALTALRSAKPDTSLVHGASYADITALLAKLDEASNRSADVLTLIESRLFEKRLTALMLPSSAPVNGPVGSGFGFRSDPFTGHAALHTGLDFPAPIGTPIVAAAGGVIMTAQMHPQYGQMVEIDHRNGLVTRYGHTSRMLVKPGDLVKRGQTIAEVGSTGRSTGPHLHFEVLVEGVQQNPAKFLAGGGVPVVSAMTPSP
jgi:murein DD-endopeptidase MepM/ murein hydrolase activator NlpD